MSKPKVYIDGKEGTTGLQIYERLSARQDIELLLIDEDKRKDAGERGKLLNAADLAFLCLPDQAAREAVELVANDRTRIIDASTAHRTAPGWAYGFPELRGRRDGVLAARRVANPGCHATGFLSGVAPLVELGVLPADYPLTCYSLTGYSGGGKKMIAQYEGEKTPDLFSPRTYGLNLEHKHLPEMAAQAGLTQPPVFCPVVDDYYKGMETVVMLHNRLLRGTPTAQDLCDMLGAYYEGQALVHVAPFGEHPAQLAANAMAGRDDLTLYVCGDGARTAVIALFDNLGKGASGAAVQNMSLMLGFAETAGLNVE